jgi:hypothetical protein
MYASISMLCLFLFVMGYVRLSQAVTLGFGYEIKDNKAVINKVYPHLPAEEAGIQVGDVLIEIAGIPFTEENNWQAFKAGIIEPGKTESVSIERGGERTTKSITPISVYSTLPNKGLDVLQFLILISAGLFVITRKPESIYTRMLAYIFLAAAVFIGGGSFPASMLTWIDLLRRMGFQASFILFPTMVHFALIYPERKRIVVKYPSLVSIIYIPTALLILYGIVQHAYVFFFADGKWVRWIESLEIFSSPRIYSRLIVSLIFVGLLFHSFFAATTSINKRKMRWLFVGLLIGVIPFLGSEIVNIFSSVLDNNTPLRQTVHVIITIFFFAVPVCFTRSVLIEEKETG